VSAKVWEVHDPFSFASAEMAYDGLTSQADECRIARPDPVLAFDPIPVLTHSAIGDVTPQEFITNYHDRAQLTQEITSSALV
jgi:hypothetical protein